MIKSAISVFVASTVLTWAVFCILLQMFGVSAGVGGLEFWLYDLTCRTIMIGSGLVVGSVGTIGTCMFKLQAVPSPGLMIALMLLAQLVGFLVLPAWVYLSDSRPASIADSFYNRNPSIFACRDAVGVPYCCTTTSSQDEQYVNLTNQLYCQTFVQHCIDQSMAFLITAPMIACLVAYCCGLDKARRRSWRTKIVRV